MWGMQMQMTPPPPRDPRGRKYRNSADGRETDTAS
jgi:hypothetical protein